MSTLLVGSVLGGKHNVYRITWCENVVQPTFHLYRVETFCVKFRDEDYPDDASSVYIQYFLTLKCAFLILLVFSFLAANNVVISVSMTECVSKVLVSSHTNRLHRHTV